MTREMQFESANNSTEWQAGGQGNKKQPRPKIQGSQNRARIEKQQVKVKILPPRPITNKK